MLRQSNLCLSFLSQITSRRYAGHSKWANIKHIKAAKDSQRAATFYKYARMIRLAIQEGGGSTNPELNSNLKSVVQMALKGNMPMSTINNNIKKFNANDAKLEKHFLEIKITTRLFMICELYTDSMVNVKPLINVAMRKAGGKSVYADIKHAFDEVAYVQATKKDETIKSASDFEDKLTEDAIECDAEEVEDIDFEQMSATFICLPRDIEKVKKNLMAKGYSIDHSDHIFIPVQVFTPTEQEKKVYDKLKHLLNQIDGVENLFDNVEHSEV
ncbi:CLUMA_CG019041, isoform A [Clunio marinus]|uniref:CLUMA_CG019041, isoform A n=1 Tax=Clunio marinus TaxID=568069 RepID=A0A1J1J198_9DIPT|nr:CLUMA_CG019041, isoform A [Clunio marinus]